jgi:alcohol dehydrogenase (cytochrome c)
MDVNMRNNEDGAKMRFDRRSMRLYALAVLLFVFHATASWAGLLADTNPGYTAQQAVHGKLAYQKHCASCHGPELKGRDIIPPLSGERFAQRWSDQPIDLLFGSIMRMPPGHAMSLPFPAYTSVLTFLLSENGIPPSNKALTVIVGGRGVKVGSAIKPPAAKVTAQHYLSEKPGQRLHALSSVSANMLKDPPAADWLLWNRRYDSSGYSPLDQVDRSTVNSLSRAWQLPLTAGESMPAPLVHDGVMFLYSYPDTVMALDAASGELLWRYRHKPRGPAGRKMGIALSGDKVLVPTSDMQVLALHAKSGELAWRHELAVLTPEGGLAGPSGYELRSSPLVVGDKVILGITASVVAGGGLIMALDLDTGKEAWRFHTLARPGEAGGNSWNELPLARRSGGSVWIPGSYDPQLNLVYFGVAPTYDTAPLLQSLNKPGVTNDALYTNSTVALNPDNGELIWHYQHLANDQWDMDWVFERQIDEFQIDGVKRKVVFNVGKLAILDGLDAATGEYLFSIDMGLQNIVSAIDPKTGKKSVPVEAIPSLSKTHLICPTPIGARSWPPSAYNPVTQRLYLPLTEACMDAGPNGPTLLTSGVGMIIKARPDSDGNWGRLQAVDMKKQALEWQYRTKTPLVSSVLATAGGLVFTGDLEPSLKAFNDETGELLWQTSLDDHPSSNLVTYAVDGKQYIAVVLGYKNNHVRDWWGVYSDIELGPQASAESTSGAGPSLWVFALEQ